MKSIASPTPKLPRNRCHRCGMRAPAPIVVGSACTNAKACATRLRPRRVKARSTVHETEAKARKTAQRGDAAAERET